MKHPSRATRLAEARAAQRSASRRVTQKVKETAAAEHLAAREDQAVALAGPDPLATLMQRRAARGVDASRDRCLSLLPLSVAQWYHGSPFQKRYAQRGEPKIFKVRNA